MPQHESSRKLSKPMGKETFARIVPLKSLYYFKFLGVLAQYVEYIKEGCEYIPELKNIAIVLKSGKSLLHN